MRDLPEIGSEPPADPEDLVDHIRHAAGEIRESLDGAGEDEQTRHDLLHALADELGPEGIRLVDVHDVRPYAPELNPDALNGRIGRSGRTRAQVLADLALINAQNRRRRR